MRKNVFIICLIVSTLIFISLFVGSHSRRYKLTGASLQRVIIEDDTIFNDKTVYLLEFNVKFCDNEWTFMSPALEPGVFGCVDSVIRISVIDSCNNEIYFSHEPKRYYRMDMLKGQFLLPYEMSLGKPFHDLVNDINKNRDNGKKFYILEPRCYLVNDKNSLPKCMKIYLENKVIDCSVNNSPQSIRNIVEIKHY